MLSKDLLDEQPSHSSFPMPRTKDGVLLRIAWPPCPGQAFQTVPIRQASRTPVVSRADCIVPRPHYFGFESPRRSFRRRGLDHEPSDLACSAVIYVYLTVRTATSTLFYHYGICARL